jgi:hypothetical protein
MRAASALRIWSLLALAIQYPRLRWQQAGFSGFAYRLAHLAAPRAALVGGLALIFLIV